MIETALWLYQREYTNNVDMFGKPREYQSIFVQRFNIICITINDMLDFVNSKSNE